MRSASDAFARTVARSHVLVTRADILFDRQVIVEGVPVVDGQIRFDRTAARLAALDCTIADPGRIPTSSTDVLTPFGYEIRIWRGVQIATETSELLLDEDDEPLRDEFGDRLRGDTLRTASTELLPLGTFPIQTSHVGAIDLVTTIRSLDRSQLVSDARFEDDYQVAAGTNYATAIEDLITDGVTGLEFLFPSISFTTPLLTFAAQADRWEAAQKMARSCGMEIFFDGLGRCVMRPEPTFDSQPVASIAVAANLLDASVTLDRSTAYNRVIAVSLNAATNAQYRGVATDDDPESPTYYDGPFGRKPRFYASEFIASDAQAESAAAAILASNLGVAKTVPVEALPDPRLECSDVVRVTCPDLEIDDLHIIDAITVSLGPEDPMSAVVRAQEGVATVG